MRTGENQGRAESGNYEYVTARVRARMAALFDDDDYRKLVRMGPGEVARFMEETEYEAEMNELGARHSGVDLVEYALNRNLAKHFEDLLRFSDGRLYDLVARYLRKFDAWNVKTALRGLYSGASRREIEDDFVRAGELAEDRLDRLAAADSVEAAADVLSNTIFGEELETGLADYEETGTLVALENAADRAFYETLLSGLPTAVEGDSPIGLYLEFLRAEIDFRNLRNALRIARSGAAIDPSGYYIEGGQLFDANEIRQLTGNTDQLVEHIRESTYGDDLEEAVETLENAETLIQFEHALHSAELEYADRLSNRYPLSVCPVLSYILLKEREIENVRAIARGREAGLDPEEIERELVIR
jgi:ATP synthase A1, C subunit